MMGSDLPKSSMMQQMQLVQHDATVPAVARGDVDGATGGLCNKPRSIITTQHNTAADLERLAVAAHRRGDTWTTFWEHHADDVVTSHLNRIVGCAPPATKPMIFWQDGGDEREGGTRVFIALAPKRVKPCKDSVLQ
jgi:hypothetical protein